MTLTFRIILSLILLSNIFLIADDQKIKDLSQKISDNPKQAENYFRRAYEYKKTKQYENAIKDFDTILKLYPETKRAFQLKTHLLLITKQFKKIEASYSITEQTKEGDKKYKRLAKDLINLIQTYDIPEKTSQDYIINLFKNNINHLDKWQKFQAVKMIEKLKRYQAAIEVFLLILNKKDPNHYITLGNLYTKNKQYDLALENLKKGMDRNPLEPFCQNHIAYQLLTYPNKKERKVKMALKLVLKASKDTNQSSEDIEDTLGLAYFLNGDIKNAIIAQRRSKNITEKLYKDKGSFHKIHRSQKYLDIVKQLNKFLAAQKQIK